MVEFSAPWYRSVQTRSFPDRSVYMINCRNILKPFRQLHCLNHGRLPLLPYFLKIKHPFQSLCHFSRRKCRSVYHPSPHGQDSLPRLFFFAVSLTGSLPPRSCLSLNRINIASLSSSAYALWMVLGLMESSVRKAAD